MPTHSTPGVTGDSLMLVVLGKYDTPSSSESVVSVGIWPMMASERRSTPVVRSPSDVHVVPRSTDFQTSRMPA